MFTCKQVRAGDIGNDVLLLEEILKARGLYNGALGGVPESNTKMLPWGRW